MFRFNSNSPNLLAIALILAGIALCCLPLIRPQAFKRQDVLLILVAFACGGILFWKGKYLDGFIQFGQWLLLVPAIAYTIESIRLRK